MNHNTSTNILVVALSIVTCYILYIIIIISIVPVSVDVEERNTNMPSQATNAVVCERISEDSLSIGPTN